MYMVWCGSSAFAEAAADGHSLGDGGQTPPPADAE
jgi:hypothetical protein